MLPDHLSKNASLALARVGAGFVVAFGALALAACAKGTTLLSTDNADAGDADVGEAGTDKDAGSGSVDAGSDTGASLSNAKRVFVTRNAQAGDFGSSGGGSDGVTSGDLLCQQAANAAHLNGTFKAYLSDVTSTAHDRIAAVGPWTLVDGTTVVFPGTSVASVPTHAIDMDETGDTAGSTVDVVWTGTKLGGLATGVSCANWSDTSTTGTTGSVSAIDVNWVDKDDESCTTLGRLYCFEQ